MKYPAYILSGSDDDLDNGDAKTNDALIDDEFTTEKLQKCLSNIVLNETVKIRVKRGMEFSCFQQKLTQYYYLITFKIEISRMKEIWIFRGN